MTRNEIQNLKNEIKRLENRALDMVGDKKTSQANSNHKRLEQLRKKLKEIEQC